MQAFNAISLGQTVLSLYKGRRIDVSFLVEGKDVKSYVYVPICSLSLGNELTAKAVPEETIRKSVSNQGEYQELRKSGENGQGEIKAVLKQVDAYVAEAAISSERWLRDCQFAAGLLEPTYSLLGYLGRSKTGQVTFGTLGTSVVLVCLRHEYFHQKCVLKLPEIAQF